MNLSSLLVLFLLTVLTPVGLDIPPPTETQESCRVRLPDLAGSYDGACRRGKAHGQGKAIGRDTYEGAFAKGFPHGQGTYTWANGDYYEGEFVKGSKEGEGKMVFASVKTDSVQTDSIQAGLWKNDQFLGEEM
ncbi:MAG: hypothetical protein WA958_17500 [Tunicatimonas sp.]